MSLPATECGPGDGLRRRKGTMTNLKSTEKPMYQAPSVESLGEGELLDKIGPAQAYTGNFPFGF